MSRRDAAIDSDPKVRALADAMGVREPRGLLREIPKRAADKVARWASKCSFEPASIDELHRFVLNQTQLRVERIERDEDLQRIEHTYRGERPALGTQLEFEFERGNTEAFVFKRSPLDARFVAVVDARGDRRYRAWFASWHEPSHLVVPDSEAKTLFRRTKVRRPEPVEQVIDVVASTLGFWDPIIRPALARALTSSDNVLDAFDAVRRDFVPEASWESTYRALTQMVDFPLVVLRVGYGSRRADNALPDKLRSLALRAQTVIANDLAAGHKMEVWPNFRIPVHSVIAVAFENSPASPLIQTDRLENWKDSKGRRLGPCLVRVTAYGSWATIELAG